MLPMRLQLVKQLLLKGPNSLRPAAATAVAERPITMTMPFPCVPLMLTALVKPQTLLTVLLSFCSLS